MKTKALRPERRLWAVRSMIVASLLVSLLSWSAGPVFAAGGQFGSISGTIVDSETKAAISGAKVTAASPSGSGYATTGSNGFPFFERRLPADADARSVHDQRLAS
jgi:hypothetical protein